MRFIVMHKTNAQWEAGETPSAELIARVGALIGELVKANALRAGEGLRASSLGVRLKFSGGACESVAGPFEGDNELPSGFDILSVESLDEAVDWASRLATASGDAEVDVRPVTEPWDLGMMPKPDGLTKVRYMALRKATAATEAGAPPAAARSRILEEAKRDGVLLVSETLKPSRRGRRYKNSGEGVRVIDGPFTESKELIAGYVIVEVATLEDADRWARRYLETVDAQEVDLRELEDESP